MISLVINVKNGEDYIEKCINSAKDISDEIIVVDDESTDKTVEIAKKFTKKIFKHKSVGYVEPARNFAIDQAKGKWILLLDADEELTIDLKNKLLKIKKENKVDFVKIPRANIIFNKHISHSGWWPDYQIRFFKKDKVKWLNEIHSQPQTNGIGEEIEINSKLAIIHHNYKTISDYIVKMNKYTDIQAKEKVNTGYKFNLTVLLNEPFSEFTRRYFIWKGYEDGIHGLVLAILQAISEFILYLKIWQYSNYINYDKSTVIKNIEMASRDSFIKLNKSLPKNRLSKLKGKIIEKLL